MPQAVPLKAGEEAKNEKLWLGDVRLSFGVKVLKKIGGNVLAIFCSTIRITLKTNFLGLRNCELY